MMTVNIKDFIGHEEEYHTEKALKIVGIAPADCTELFAELNGCEVLDVSELDTSEVEIMDYMFNFCHSVKALDLSGFDTSKVRSMKGMFSNCWDLEEIKGLESFNTDALENARWLFNECRSLEKFDASRFDRDGIDKIKMYRNCKTVR